MTPNKRFQATPSRGAQQGAPEPVRYPAYAKQSEAAPVWYEFCRTLTRKCRPSQGPSTASSVDSGVGWLISMET